MFLSNWMAVMDMHKRTLENFMTLAEQVGDAVSPPSSSRKTQKDAGSDD